jgi:hypothetical protein
MLTSWHVNTAPYQSLFLPLTTLLDINFVTLASGGSKQAWHVPDAVCTVLELLMLGGETAGNM